MIVQSIGSPAYVEAGGFGGNAFALNGEHPLGSSPKTASILTPTVEKNYLMYSKPKRVSLSSYVINTTSTLLPSMSLNSLSNPLLCVSNPLAISFSTSTTL